MTTRPLAENAPIPDYAGVTIDILCKVVDNFGDIGVVYRLARALSELDEKLELRLIVDDLRAFKALEPLVNDTAAVQIVRGWTIVSASGAPELFRARRPRFVVECFACGRPDWYEEILFDPTDEARKLIVNLEYLSAEDYAIELHKAPSLTRSSSVRKAMFMPGFSAGTGGLIIDRRFAELRDAYSDARGRSALRKGLAERLGFYAPDGDYWVCVFSYERHYGALVRDMAEAAERQSVTALVAAGRSEKPFLSAWEAAGRPFNAVAMPFLPQEEWDEVLLAADFALVRGEESLARAALSGRPFLWHAYLQDDGYQIVKVRALLDRMRPFFASGDFAPVERAFIAFNDRKTDDPDSPLSDEGFAEYLRAARTDAVKAGFAEWAESVADTGNLAEGLLTFLRDFG